MRLYSELPFTFKEQIELLKQRGLIFTDEEKTAWINYVKAVANRYKGKITYYEVWNEPDGKWCWKHGANAEELGIFTKDTAIAVKEVDKNAKIIVRDGDTVLREIHPSKAQSVIIVIVLGTVIAVILSQQANAPEPMVVRAFGKLTALSAVHI